eukprot:15450805-Alexandrium_andersonii.AAC.1
MCIRDSPRALSVSFSGLALGPPSIALPSLVRKDQGKCVRDAVGFGQGDQVLGLLSGADHD